MITMREHSGAGIATFKKVLFSKSMVQKSAASMNRFFSSSSTETREAFSVGQKFLAGLRKTVVPGILFMALLLNVQKGWGQNAIVGAGFASGWGGACGSNANFSYFSAGAGSSYTSGSLTPNGTGNQYWRIGVDWGGTVKQIHLNTTGTDVNVSPNTTYTLNGTCVTGGAMFVNVSATTNRYVFKTRDAGSAPSNNFVFFALSGAPTTVSAVTQGPVSGTVSPNMATTITATTVATPPTGQGVWLRYTTDNFATSTIVQMTGSTTTYTANIPAGTNSAGTTVRYYVFTSGTPASIAHGDADFYTINLNNNSGSNYSYTVANGWTTAAAGNWNAAATWTANAIPPTASSMGAVTIAHNVTQNADATASSITINAATTLTATTNTLTINNGTSGTTFTNNGTLTSSGTHAVTFSGAATHTVSGTVAFNNVNTSTGVNFGSGGTVNGTFTINSGGFVATNAPAYGASSTLTYNIGASYTAGTEWTANALSGQGVPNNVTLTLAGTNLTFGTASQYRRLRGSLTISASTTLTLSTNLGGDLRLGGNWTNSGTFTSNSRAVFFDGSAAQTINATATNFAFLLISNTSATVTANAAVTVTGTLTIDANARLDMAANVLTITGATSAINGFLRSAVASTTPITGASTSTLTFNNGGTFESNASMAAVSLAGLGIPIATWNSGSTCSILGLTTPSAGSWFGAGLTQTFSNFTWNCASQSTAPNMSGATITCTGTFTMSSTGSSELRLGSGTSGTITCGNFTQTGGVINCASGAGSGTINVSGTFNQGSGTITETSTGSGTINLNASSGNQNVTQSGTVLNTINWNVGTGSSTNTATLLTGIATAGTFTVANNASLDFGTNIISGAGTFVATTGATLISANTSASGAINTTGANGSVQTTTRTFTNAGVNYTFNGASAQFTGNAIGAASNIRNLTFNTTGTLTLSSAATLSATGTLTFGTNATRLVLGANDLTLTSGSTVTGAGSTKYVQTNSTGRLLRTALTTGFTFPIGNSAYNPITVTNTGASDTYGFIVLDGAVSNAVDASKAVNRSWAVTEAVSGGGNLQVIPQFNTGEFGGSYATGSGQFVGLYIPSAWTENSAGASASGSNPFTVSASGFTNSLVTSGSTNYFAVGNAGAFVAVPVTYTWTGGAGNGLWTSPSNWSPGTSVAGPTSSDHVVIANTASTLNISGTVSCTDFTVNSGATFAMAASSAFTVSGNYTYNGSAPTFNCSSTLNISSSSSQTIPAHNYGNLNLTGGARVLASSGTIGICGTYTPGSSTTITGSTVNFNGTGAQTINATAYNNLSISNNRGAAVVTLPAGTIAVGGTFDVSTYASATNPSNSVSASSIFDFTSASAQTIPAFFYGQLNNTGNGPRTLASSGIVDISQGFNPSSGTTTITGSTIRYSNASAGVWSLTNFTTNVASRQYNNLIFAGGASTIWNTNGLNLGVAGTLNVTAGTFRVSSGSSGTLTVDGTLTIDGGTMVGSATPHASTINANGNVTLSSGTLTLSGAAATSTLNIANDRTLAVNGGTLNVATTASGTGIINAGTSTTATTTTTITLGGGALVLGSGGTGTINAYADLNMTSGSISQSSGTATINFLKPGTTAVARGTSVITQASGTFSGTIAINIGNGTVIYPLLVLGSPTINIGSATTLTVTANGMMDCGASNILSGGTFTLATQGTLVTANTAGITTGASGSVQTTNRNFGTLGYFIYNGTSPQVTGNAFPSQCAIFSVFNSSSAGVTLSNPLTIPTGGQLILFLTPLGGILDIANNNLTFQSGATVAGAGSSYFIRTSGTGRVIKTVGVTATPFEVGNSTYNPITLTNSGTSDTYGIVVSDGAVPNATISSACVNRRWIVTEGTGGGGNLSISAQYSTGQTGGTYSTGSQVYTGLYIPSSWNTATTTVTGSNPFAATGSGFNQTLPISGTTAYFAIGNENMFISPPAIITTVAASSVGSSTASTGGQGISGLTLTAKGVVYSTAAVSTSPTLANSVLTDGTTTTANFTSNLTGLSPETQYYARAYATNAAGTGYGPAVNFRTLSNEPTAEATSFSATANGSTQIDLSWAAAGFPASGATATGYIILGRSDATNPTTTNVTDGVSPASLSLPAGTTLVNTITSGLTTAYSNTGLLASTQYNYLIIPFTWDGTNTGTYNYLLTSAPAANATTDAGLPAVTATTAITGITHNGASSGGSGLVSGGSTINAKGVAYNTTGTPTIASSTTNDGTGTADFSSTISGLSAQTLYYVRAYATNAGGSGYANELSFRTLSNPATAQATGLSANPTAPGELTLSWTGATFPSSGATQGGYALIYSTGSPTLSSANGNAPAAGVGTLITITPTNLPSLPSTSYILSGLTPGTTYNFLLVPFTWDGSNNTTYHYLSTSAPTVAGTAVTTASVTTTAAGSISNSTASSGGSAINAGGGSISAKGVVWNTSPSPTTANNSTNDGTGTSSFSSSLTTLNPQTLYYHRAYVTNPLGTVYGNELSFYSLSNPPTAQAAGLSGTATSQSSINLNWTPAGFPGSGATVTGYVLLRATSPNTPILASTNGAAPSAGVNTTIVNSAVSGGANSVSASGLSAITTYNFLLVPFTWDGSNASTYHYLTSSAPSASATTFSAAPAAQPTAITFSAVTSSTITTSWTAATGSPSGYIVLRSTGSAPNTDPVSGTTYTAGNTLGNATVVFSGSAVTTGAQTGLTDGTTYFYEVFSYNGSGTTINYLTTSPLSGSQATSAISAPVATAATSVTSGSFIANWNSVSGAAGYRLDVGTSSCFVTLGGSSTNAEGFAGGTTPPAGWSFTAIGGTYTSAGNFGLASPSLQMDATNDRVVTNQLSGAVATEISFWLKGNSTDAASALLVEGTTDGTNWVTIENITSSIPTTGTIKTYNFSSSPVLPCGMIRFRFTYTKSAGNLAFDDVTITSASATPAFVSGYNDLSVSGTTQSVTGLSNNTTYYYRVRAVGSNSTSGNSNTINLTTLVDISVADFRSVSSGNWNNSSVWEFYNGLTWVGATQAPGSTNNVTIQAAHALTLNVSHTIAAGKTITLNGALNAGSNTFDGAGSFSMAASGVLNTAHASGLAGTLQLTTPANASFPAGATFQFSGTTVNTGFSTFPNLSSSTLYNMDWLGTTSLTLDKSIRLTTLNFTNAGLIYLGNFDLTIAASGSISGTSFSASKMLVTDGTGTLVRLISSGTGIPFTWPIGEASGTTEYSPVTITTLAGNSASNASIGFRVVDAIEPNMGLASHYISRYWVYSTANLTAGASWSNATFTYTAADIVGNQSLFKANAFNSGSLLWTEFSGSSAASNVLTFTSGATTSTVLTGNSITARLDPPIYYRSNGSGDWNTTSTWIISTDPAFVSPTGVAAVLAPNNSNSAGIDIRNGHTVAITSAVTADDLTISNGGILSVTSNGITIANGSASNDLIVQSGGTFQFSSASNNSLTINSGAAVQVNGLMKNNGAAGSPDITNNGTITISSTGTYEHGRNAGTIPTCTWSVGSICLVSGTTSNAPGGLGQSFHHFTVNTTLSSGINCSGLLTTINGKFKLSTNHASNGWRLTSSTSYTLTVGDSMIIQNGVLDLVSGTISSGSATINANGPVSMSGATALITKTGGSTAVFNANGNFAQNAGTIEMNASSSSNTTFNFLGNVTLNGTVQRTAGGIHVINFSKSSGQQDFSFGGTQGSGAITWNIGSGTTTNTLRLNSGTWNLGSSAHTINVNNNAIFDLQSGVVSGAATLFNALSGSTLYIGHVQGITSGTTAEGNIQTNGIRTFSGGANYRYTGNASQATGNGLPSAITGSLTMANTGSSGNNTLTLTTSSTTVSTLNLSSGLFAAGTSQQINIASGGTVNVTSGDFVSGAAAGTIHFNGSGSWTGNSNPYTVSASGGVNFGSGTVTIQNGGTFRINGGGFVNTNAPVYSAGSTLEYNVNNLYGRGLEWSTTSGKGYPHHVLLTNNTTLNPASAPSAPNANVPMRCAGNLTISSGSNIYMDYDGNNMTEDLRVLGDLSFSGNFSGSGVLGSDIYVGGNWTNNGSGINFFPNSRAVFFNGSSNQNIGGSNSGNNNFEYIFIDNAAGVTLTSPQSVSNQLTFSNGRISLGTHSMTMVGSATLSGFSDTRYFVSNSTGQLIQNVSGVNTFFPVGPTAAIYAPVTLNQSGTSENIGVRVIHVAGLPAPSFGNAVNDTTQMLKLEWVMNESVPGANSIRTTFGWQGAGTAGAANIEGSGFDRNTAKYHGNWNGSRYVVRATDAVSGINPYFSLSTIAQPFTGLLSNQRFVVGNINGIMPCFQTAAAGDWNTASNWVDNQVPPADAAVCINHALTLSAAPPNPSVLTIGASGNLSVSSGVSLTLEPGGTFTNNRAGFNMTSGTLVFQGGTSTINGSQAAGLYNLEINGNTTLTTVPTINNQMEIKAGGFIISGNGPVYGPSSTLVYNTGGNYNRSNEWRSASGAGYPANVLVTGNTSLNLNAGTAINRSIQGNMQIDNGSSVSQGTSSFDLIVPGNFTLNGSYTQSSTLDGDLILGGNWTSGSAATLTSNNRDVSFNGNSGTQTISNAASGLQFGFLTIDNTGAGVNLLNNITASTFRVNPGRTFSMSSSKIIIAANGEMLINGTFNANNGTIEFTNGGRFRNNGTFNRGTSTLDFLPGAASPGEILGTVQTNFHNIYLGSNSGIDFNSGALRGRISGVFQLRSGSYVSNNAPIYEAGSKLMYSGGGTFNRNVEWDAATLQRVEIRNNTILKGGTNGTGFNHSMADSLIIQSGSAMDFTSPDVTTPFVVGGSVLLQGTLTLSNASGADLRVAGDWNNDSGTFNCNGRLTTFDGAATARLKGPSTTTFCFLTVNKSSGVSFTADAPVSVSRPPAGTELRISGGTFDLNGQSLNLGAGSNTLRINEGDAAGQTLRTGGTSITGFNNYTDGTNAASLGGIVDFSGTSGETYPANVLSFHQLWNSGSGNKVLPQSIVVKDDMKTEASATIDFGASAFNIEVRADLFHQGTTSGSGTGAVILNGTTTQNMSGNGTYRNLEINKASNNVNSSGRPTITGKLNLISGKILQASANDSITLGATATITETIGVDEAYVKGKLSTTRVVGTAAEDFGGMGISLTAGANLGTVTATRQSGVVLTGDPSCCAGFTTIARNWHIVPTVQPSAANRNLSLSWPSEDDNLMNINSLQLWKRSSMVAVWQPIGDLQDVSATNPRVAAWTGVSSFSQFTGADLDNPLPLGLMSFNGTNEKGNAVLRWQVSESERFTGYKVQKSEDGNAFRDLTFVTQGNEKSGTASHAFTDMNLITNSYYKIGLVNKSGKTEWSQVVYIKASEINNADLVLIPNPSSSGTRLSMGGRFSGSDELQLSIFGTDGRNLGESRGKLDIINRDLPEMVKNLPKGIYQIRVISEPETKTLRFMKD